MTASPATPAAPPRGAVVVGASFTGLPTLRDEVRERGDRKFGLA